MEPLLAKDQPARILIADDDAGLRYLARTILQQAGFATVEAEDGAQALAAFQHQPIDLVMLDVDMPRLDGFSACAQLRALAAGADTPILMVTGLNDTDSINRAYQAGATDFITKPINWLILSQRLRYMLRASAALANIRYLAYYDSLTNLPNRQACKTQLEQLLSAPQGPQARTALLFIDLDNFRQINDTLGHTVGDLLLLQVAERLRSGLENDSTQAIASLARLGGDEFCALLQPNKTPLEIVQIARCLLANLGQPLHLAGHEITINASIGIAIHPQDGQDADTLLKHADTALHKAKEAGKATYRFYTESMSQRALARFSLENRLRKALQQEQLQLYYQPQIALIDGTLIGVEALLRWRHPELGLVAPNAFIPVAEQTDLIASIGEWVLHTACSQAKTWQNTLAPKLRIAVNLSALQFHRSDILTIVGEALANSGLIPENLELELTESLLMYKEHTTVAVLRALKNMGVTLALDDFGTGYSSLSYLQRFPIDTLKIDRSFTQGLDSSDNAAIVNAIIAMAHSLNLTVIAEGVETTEQEATLRAWGCDHIQGFLISHPLNSSAFTHLLQTLTAAGFSAALQVQY